MDQAAKIKKQPGSAAPPRPPAAAEAAAKKKPTTLLDAYEVECIRRELDRLFLKHNHNHQSAAAGAGITAAASPNAHGNHRCHDGNHLHGQHIISKATSAKRVSPSPSLPPPDLPTAGPNKKGRRGVRILGRHVVGICSGTAPVAGAPVSARQGASRRRDVQRGTTAPVACATVGGRS